MIHRFHLEPNPGREIPQSAIMFFEWKDARGNTGKVSGFSYDKARELIGHDAWLRRVSMREYLHD